MTPKIQIITIGNELLEGRIQNTNVNYICKKLYKAGYLAASHCSVLDDKKTLKETIEESLKAFDIVICSGGLGLTQDDLTLDIAAEIFKSDFHINPSLFERLLKQYQARFERSLIEALARVPKKAEPFNKYYGNSPGFILKKGKKRLLLLPGVPHEFEYLVDQEVIPYIKKLYPLVTQEYKKVIHLCRVPEAKLTPFLDELLKKNKKVDLGIYPSLGILSIHVKVKSAHLKDANLIIDPYIKAIKKKYGQRAFDGSFETIEEAVHHFFISKNLTLSLAESCTGGLLSSTLVNLPNASKYFKGSLVCYQNEVKQNLLKVSKSTLEKEGAVSEKCVVEMARGAAGLLKSDIAIAISGIAGPDGGTKEKPVGTIFVAITYKDKILSHLNFQLSGDRKTIMKRTVNYALAEFWMIRDNI